MIQWIVGAVFLFCYLSWSAPAEKKQTESKSKANVEESETFMPSLSETISDSNRRKSNIKRQLAEEWDGEPESSPINRDVASKTSQPKKEVANFGDLEVSISTREEEELEDIQKTKSSD